MNFGNYEKWKRYYEDTYKKHLYTLFDTIKLLIESNNIPLIDKIITSHKTHQLVSPNLHSTTYYIIEECKSYLNSILEIFELILKNDRTIFNELTKFNRLIEFFKGYIDCTYTQHILQYTADIEEIEIGKLFVAIGYNFNLKNSNVYYNTVSNRSFTMVKLFIEGGHNVTNHSGLGCTYPYAQPNLCEDKFRYLIKKGANMYSYDTLFYLIKRDGHVGTSCAQTFNAIPSIKFMIKHGFDINNYQKCWPTGYPCSYCHAPVACSHMNIIGSPNIELKNPLIVATVKGNVRMMKLLIENGFNLKSYLEGQYFMDFISKPNKYGGTTNIDHTHLLHEVLKIMNKRISLLSQCIFYVRKDIESYRKYFHLLNKDIIELLTKKVFD